LQTTEAISSPNNTHHSPNTLGPWRKTILSFVKSGYSYALVFDKKR